MVVFLEILLTATDKLSSIDFFLESVLLEDWFLGFCRLPRLFGLPIDGCFRFEVEVLANDHHFLLFLQLNFEVVLQVRILLQNLFFFCQSLAALFFVAV